MGIEKILSFFHNDSRLFGYSNAHKFHSHNFIDCLAAGGGRRRCVSGTAEKRPRKSCDVSANRYMHVCAARACIIQQAVCCRRRRHQPPQKPPPLIIPLLTLDAGARGYAQKSGPDIKFQRKLKDFKKKLYKVFSFIKKKKLLLCTSTNSIFFVFRVINALKLNST